jgi:hypothetical protein
MADAQQNEFPATALIDTHLKLLDIAGAGEELLEALTDLIRMGRIGDEPDVVLDAAGTRHLVWRGYMTGGLITAWLRLGSALRDADVSAFIGDPRLEVFIPSDGEVAVFGALRRAVQLSWDDWDQRVRAADSVEDLVAGFVNDALNDSPLFQMRSPDPTHPASDDDQDDFPAAERLPMDSLYGPRSEFIEQLAPGEIDWELVDESDSNLTISCDPEGNVEEESVVCDLMRWRTRFTAPGTPIADEPWEQSFEWAVGQWQWRTDGDEGGESEEEWVIRGKQPLSVGEVLERLPSAFRAWVLDATRRAIQELEHLAEDDPSFAAALKTLRDEIVSAGPTSGSADQLRDTE